MAKYEIMLVISGSIEEKKAKTIASEIASSIKETKPQVEELGLKELAYKINNNTHGFYFQYNFECEDPAMINEFRRLSTINKNVLRHLIINLEKDYGYRATINPKKMKSNAIKAEIHARRKAEYEKIKEARNKELGINKQNDEIIEAIDAKKQTSSKATETESKVEVKKETTKKATKTTAKKETTKTAVAKETKTTTKKATTAKKATKA